MLWMPSFECDQHYSKSVDLVEHAIAGDANSLDVRQPKSVRRDWGNWHLSDFILRCRVLLTDRNESGLG